ncbi:MAG: hypothetical protein ACXW03_10280 [Methylobacter sp.]
MSSNACSASSERRKLFPSNHSAMKAGFLAIERTAKKWSVPIRD